MEGYPVEQIYPSASAEYKGSAAAGMASGMRKRRELLQDYIELSSVRFFLDRSCADPGRPILLYGNGPRGKTAALTAWTPVTGGKVLVNCGADERYRYWPEIAHRIITQINEADGKAGTPDFVFKNREADSRKVAAGSAPDGGRGVFYATDAEREAFRAAFVRWLKGLRLRKQLWIVINDLDLLTGDGAGLTWLPEETGGNLHLVCSADSDVIAETASVLGWNVMEFPLLSAADAALLLDRFLGQADEEISPEQRAVLLQSPLISMPGWSRRIVRFLSGCGGFGVRPDLIAAAGAAQTPQALYALIWDTVCQKLTAEAQNTARTAFSVLACTTVGLRENELYAITAQLMPTNAVLWSGVRALLDEFELLATDVWHMDDPALRDLVQTFSADLPSVHAALSRFFRSGIEETPDETAQAFRRCTELSAAAVRHMTEARRWEPLCELLTDRRVLRYLVRLEWDAVRSAWMHVRIESDLDVADRLSALLKGLVAEDSGIETARFRILSLMEDLEFSEAAEAASALTGLRAHSTFRQPDRNRMSERAEAAYDGFCRDREKRDPEALCGSIEAYLTRTEQNLTAYEACRFLWLKGDCELRLKRFNELGSTAEHYERAAVRAGSGFELLRAGQLRGESLYRAARYEEAAVKLDRATALAERMGAMREYLSAEKLSALCGVRLGDFDRSIEALDFCSSAWERLGDIREAAAIRIEVGAAQSDKGDREAALRTSQRVYRELRRQRSEDRTDLELLALGRIGELSAALGKTKEAEQAYCLALDRSGDCPEFDPAPIYRGLIGLYRDQRFYTRAIRASESFAEHLYETGNYAELASVVRGGAEMMRTARYESRAESYETHWKQIFDGLPDGPALFEKAGTGLRRPRVEETLLQAFAEAKSRGENLRCAELQVRLAELRQTTDPVAAAESFLQAEAFCRAAGAAEQAEDCRNQAVRVLIPVWETAQEAKALAGSLDGRSAETADLWAALRRGGLSRERCRSAAAELLSPERRGDGLTELCLIDMSGELAACCEAEQLIRLLARMDESRLAEQFRPKLEAALARDFSDQLSALTRDPSGPQTKEQIRKAQKDVVLLEKLGSSEAAGSAEDLAQIFRRRNEPELTLYYYRKAMELFQKAGAERDCCAEALNLAEALCGFGAQEQAAELLRAELRETEHSKYAELRAAVAGKLAGLLTDLGDASADAEIRACFAIEESVYESAGEDRELVISLLNQLKYGLRSGKSADEGLQQKYDKARELVFRNRMREFYPVMQQLETIFEPGRSTSEEQNTGPRREEPDPELRREGEGMAAFLQRLIQAEGSYALTAAPEISGGFVQASCVLREPIPMLNVSLLLIADLEAASELRCIFLAQPLKAQEGLMSAVRDYAEWWNSVGSYRVKLDAEERLLSLAILLDLRDPERLEQGFAKISRLWLADAENVSAMCGGMTDQVVLREKKQAALRALSGQTP